MGFGNCLCLSQVVLYTKCIYNLCRNVTCVKWRRLRHKLLIQFISLFFLLLLQWKCIKWRVQRISHCAERWDCRYKIQKKYKVYDCVKLFFVIIGWVFFFFFNCRYITILNGKNNCIVMIFQAGQYTKTQYWRCILSMRHYLRFKYIRTQLPHSHFVSVFHCSTYNIIYFSIRWICL